MLTYALHIGGGTIGLISGTVAVFAPKGGRLHRAAGTAFVFSMLVMAVFGFYLAVVTPDQVNLFISAFALYLVLTARMTVWHRDGASGVGEKFALIVALILLAPFAILSLQLALGFQPLFKSTVAFKGPVLFQPLFKSTVAFKGPVLIAIYGFTTILGVAALSDAKVVLHGGVSGVPRIARHLWRMCLGLTLAAGSAFTNSLPRILPGSHHVPTAFFLPQFLPLGLLIFWMVRVQFTSWYKSNMRARGVVAGSSGRQAEPTH
jgi:hypothetical protein